MKKLLSIILAIAMLATFVPATFAAEEVQLNDSGVKVTYDLHSIVKENFGKVRESTKTIDFELTNGFFSFKSNNGTNGHYEKVTGKYFDVNESGDGTYYIGIADWAKVSFDIYVPKAGKYNFKMYNVVSNNANLKGKYNYVYLNKNGISTANADLIGKYTCYDETKTVTSKVAEPNVFPVEIPEAGVYTITFTTDTAGYWYSFVSTFELDGGDGSAPMRATVEIVDGIATVKNVTFSDGSVLTADEVKAKGATITYASSDVTKATVDAATGVITNKAEGQTTITAKVNLNGAIAKGQSEYLSGKLPAGITVRYDLAGEMAKQGIKTNSSESLSKITYDGTNGFFKFVAGTYSAPDTNSKLKYNDNNLQIREDLYLAFEVYVPKAGTYTMKMENGVAPEGNKPQSVDVYKTAGRYNSETYSPTGGEFEGTYDCLDNTTDTPFQVTANPPKEIDGIEIPEPGYYVFTFSTYDRSKYYYGSVGSFSLVEGDGSQNAVIGGKITELSDALVVGGDTATVTAEGYLSATTGKATFTYASNNTDVATVDAATGVVTPVGAGTATITATCADAIINNVLTTEVTVEKAQIGEELDSTVQVYIDALGGGFVTKSTDETIDNVEVGTLVEVEAIAGTGYVFSHWQDSEEKYVSDSPKYSFRPYVNTSVIAVFDKTTVADGDTKTVYFYNGNGEYMTKETTTGSSIEMPANATLTGYIFDKWTVDGVNAFDGNNIVKAITRVVAKYQENGKTYEGLKINNNDTVVYDTAKTFNDNNATHWKRNGKTVAYGKEYKHYMWDAATIEAGTGTIEEIPVILLDEHSVEEDFYMIEYDLPEGYTKLEAGILFGDDTHKTVDSCYYKAKSANKPETAEHGQFTAKPSTDTTKTWNIVRGYLVYSDGVSNRVIYADITSAQ